MIAQWTKGFCKYGAVVMPILVMSLMAYSSPKNDLKRAVNHKAYGSKLSEKKAMSLAHWGALHGQQVRSQALLKSLLKRKKLTMDRDDIYLLQGRISFEMKQFVTAISAFEKVSKKSDLWLLSVEERAWAKIRSGQYEKALADSKTLMSPVFANVVTPEAYFASAYASYALCDFVSVFKTVDLFKKRSKDAILHLERLEAQKATHLGKMFLAQVSAVGLSESLSKDELAYLPRHFYRDGELIRRTKNKISSNSKRIQKRLALLSKQDLQLYRDVIGKLQLIEADVIQRLYLDQKLNGERNKLNKVVKKSKDDLEFVYDESDVWIDEIDHLQVKSQSCPQVVRPGVKI